jgi:hypothetical protein
MQVRMAGAPYQHGEALKHDGNEFFRAGQVSQNG